MAGKGPTPKNPKTRQRRNKSATQSTLIDSSPLGDGKLPLLGRRPDGKAWRKQVRDFWADVWRSPMAPEYTQADVHGLYILADLIQQYWDDPSPQTAAEIRLQRQCYGLTPIDRRRLQWEIKRVEQPDKKPKPSRPKRQNDPRAVLKSVS